jgi:hypothetical protein
MSDARWCDFGDHAYKGGRPGTVMMGMTVKESRYAQTEQDVQEMCPECAAALGILNDYEAPESPHARRQAMLEGLAAKDKKS